MISLLHLGLAAFNRRLSIVVARQGRSLVFFHWKEVKVSTVVPNSRGSQVSSPRLLRHAGVWIPSAPFPHGPAWLLGSMRHVSTGQKTKKRQEGRVILFLLFLWSFPGKCSQDFSLLAPYVVTLLHQMPRKSSLSVHSPDFVGWHWVRGGRCVGGGLREDFLFLLYTRLCWMCETSIFFKKKLNKKCVF